MPKPRIPHKTISPDAATAPDISDRKKLQDSSSNLLRSRPLAGSKRSTYDTLRFGVLHQGPTSHPGEILNGVGNPFAPNYEASNPNDCSTSRSSWTKSIAREIRHFPKLLVAQILVYWLENHQIAGLDRGLDRPKLRKLVCPILYPYPTYCNHILTVEMRDP